jgi:hypothetical protein
VLGVEVAVDPFVESERTEKYFDINAVAEGIGIVFVRVSNNTSNQTFIVEKKNFQLVLAGSSSDENADTQTIERSTSGGQAVAITGAVVGSFGGMAIMFIPAKFRRKRIAGSNTCTWRKHEGFYLLQSRSEECRVATRSKDENQPDRNQKPRIGLNDNSIVSIKIAYNHNTPYL